MAESESAATSEAAADPATAEGAYRAEAESAMETASDGAADSAAAGMACRRAAESASAGASEAAADSALSPAPKTVKCMVQITMSRPSAWSMLHSRGGEAPSCPAAAAYLSSAQAVSIRWVSPAASV